MKLHHLGIACSNINDTIVYLKQNYNVTTVSEIIFDENQNVSISMVYLKDSIPFELISGETVKPFLKRNSFVYHMCFEVVNLNQTVESFIKTGAMLISEPKSAVLFDGRPVAFLNTTIGLIEFLQA